MYYVCVHETGGLVRQALQTGIEGLSPRVRMGKESLRGGDGGDIYPVEAISPGDLRCWIRDFNAMCQRKCVHQVTVLRYPQPKEFGATGAMGHPPGAGPG